MDESHFFYVSCEFVKFYTLYRLRIYIFIKGWPFVWKLLLCTNIYSGHQLNLGCQKSKIWLIWTKRGHWLFSLGFSENYVIFDLNDTGHSAVIHACTVENEAFVGMGATLLDGVIVEKNAMVAAGALVRQNTKIPSGEVCEIFTFSSTWTFYNKLLVIDRYQEVA